MRSRIWTLVTGLLVVLGLVMSGLLLSRSLQLLTPGGQGGWNVCSTLLQSDCDAALQSSEAYRLGIPLAGWGVVYYSALGTLLVLGVVLREQIGAEVQAAAFALALIGGAISGWLVIRQAAGLSPWCPLCLAVHGINLMGILAIFRHQPATLRELGVRCRAGVTYFFGVTPATAVTTWKAVTLLVPALAAVAVYQWVLFEVSLRTRTVRAEESPAVVIRDYESQPERDIPVLDSDPRWGPDDAPVRLVVFSGFTCAGCRELSHELTYLQEHFRGKLQVVFKHFPLSSECNPHVAVNQHKRACAVAVLAESAHRQGQFWPVHRALFSLPRLDESRLQQLVRELQLDEVKLERDAQDPATWEKIRADCELGGRLGVKATPTVYLNNRLVTHLSSGGLDILIHHLLGEEGH